MEKKELQKLHKNDAKKATELEAQLMKEFQEYMKVKKKNLNILRQIMKTPLKN